jgi:serpin B
MTEDGPVYLLDGGEVMVPMMRQTESFGYNEGDGYQAVELPYDGRELSMVILLPQAGRFETFEETLDAGQVEAIVNGMETRPVSLTMPRFEFKASLSLKEILVAMGMPRAFSELADFSGMTGNRDLFISEVVHKAFVSVDEAGTEAAAATAVIMELTSVPAAPVSVTVEHPFIFLIRDIETGTIIFMGRVINPGS